MTIQIHKESLYTISNNLQKPLLYMSSKDCSSKHVCYNKQATCLICMATYVGVLHEFPVVSPFFFHIIIPTYFQFLQK